MIGVNIVLLHRAARGACTWSRLLRVARLFTELDRAQSEERALDIEHERLQTERGAGDAAAGRATAREQLAMRPATPAITQYVELTRARRRRGDAR